MMIALKEGNVDAIDYQIATRETVIYKEAAKDFLVDTSDDYFIHFLGIMYCALKLNGEAGEIAEKIGKTFRDPQGDIADPVFIEKLEKELGDVMWYVARLCDEFGLSLKEVMQKNIDKLQARKERGTLTGSGDNR